MTPPSAAVAATSPQEPDADRELPGVRVVLDARPLQEPDRAPLTAGYLDGLLGAFDALPVRGESFALLLRADLDDVTTRYDHLDVVSRRLAPPVHLLRSAALTIDPVVLTGVGLGAGWRAERGGAVGAVHHAVGSAVPLVTGLPVVVTLLDLAPWELPAAYQRGAMTRFGHRLRSRLVRDAAAVIVGSTAVAESGRRLLHLRRDRLHVVPYAPRPAFALRAASDGVARIKVGRPGADERVERERLGLPERYLVYPGRYDARQDLGTLLRALDLLGRAGRPDDLPEDVPWPPRVLLTGASPDDRAALARAAARVDVGDCLAYAPRLPDERLSALVRGARAAILPAVSDAMGLPAIEAIAGGTPVIASAVGALPEIVGSAGMLVAPRDADRLASALATMWLDDRVHRGLLAIARERADTSIRTWGDVAVETRRIYAEVVVAR